VATFRRVCDFIASERQNLPQYVGDTLLPRLNRVVQRLDEQGVEQDVGMRLQMAATRRQAVLAERLRTHYVLPLARVARHITPGLGHALRAPHKRIPRERLARTATSMTRVAEREWDALAPHLGRGFLRDMRAAAAALEAAIAGRVGPTRRHITARATVVAQLQLGRGVVRHMDALITPHVRDDSVLRSTWTHVKRYE
jgi:hypothetical protein